MNPNSISCFVYEARERKKWREKKTVLLGSSCIADLDCSLWVNEFKQEPRVLEVRHEHWRIDVYHVLSHHCLMRGKLTWVTVSWLSNEGQTYLSYSLKYDVLSHHCLMGANLLELQSQVWCPISSLSNEGQTYLSYSLKYDVLSHHCLMRGKLTWVTVSSMMSYFITV